MSTLHQAAEDYLAIRRSLGFKLVAEGYLLASFAGYAERTGARQLTADLALDWATLPAGKDPVWCAKRLSVVRGFARHLHTLDPATEVPPAGLLPRRTRRATPYLYTSEEVARLMAAARALPSPLVAATYETLVGLLETTGMRVGEAARLDRADVDLDDGVITVVAGKFGRWGRYRCSRARSTRSAPTPAGATRSARNPKRPASSSPIPAPGSSPPACGKGSASSSAPPGCVPARRGAGPGSTISGIRRTAGLCALSGFFCWWGPCRWCFRPHNPGGRGHRANDSSQPAGSAVG